MAQQAKALAAKFDKPSSIPSIHVAEEDNQLLQTVFCDTHVLHDICACVCLCVHAHIQNK